MFFMKNACAAVQEMELSLAPIVSATIHQNSSWAGATATKSLTLAVLLCSTSTTTPESTKHVHMATATTPQLLNTCGHQHRPCSCCNPRPICITSEAPSAPGIWIS